VGGKEERAMKRFTIAALATLLALGSVNAGEREDWRLLGRPGTLSEDLAARWQGLVVYAVNRGPFGPPRLQRLYDRETKGWRTVLEFWIREDRMSGALIMIENETGDVSDHLHCWFPRDERWCRNFDTREGTIEVRTTDGGWELKTVNKNRPIEEIYAGLDIRGRR
jgi:hypothetical protein